MDHYMRMRTARSLEYRSRVDWAGSASRLGGLSIILLANERWSKSCNVFVKRMNLNTTALQQQLPPPPRPTTCLQYPKSRWLSLLTSWRKFQPTIPFPGALTEKVRGFELALPLISVKIQRVCWMGNLFSRIAHWNSTFSSLILTCLAFVIARAWINVEYVHV